LSTTIALVESLLNSSIICPALVDITAFVDITFFALPANMRRRQSRRQSRRRSRRQSRCQSVDSSLEEYELTDSEAEYHSGCAAQQLAEQLTSIGIDAAQQLPFGAAMQLIPSLPAAALQPSTAPPQAGPPAYTLINAHTVADVWREYKEGIAGGPAVEQLERQWQSRWRPAAAQRTAWSRRKTVLDEVQRLIAAGLALADAVAELEA
jgi:hypothetical protein